MGETRGARRPFSRSSIRIKNWLRWPATARDLPTRLAALSESIRPVLLYWMINIILGRVLEARGIGWMLLRFAIIATPAVVALAILSTVFK